MSLHFLEDRSSHHEIGENPPPPEILLGGEFQSQEYLLSQTQFLAHSWAGGT